MKKNSICVIAIQFLTFILRLEISYITFLSQLHFNLIIVLKMVSWRDQNMNFQIKLQ